MEMMSLPTRYAFEAPESLREVVSHQAAGDSRQQLGQKPA